MSGTQYAFVGNLHVTWKQGTRQQVINVRVVQFKIFKVVQFKIFKIVLSTFKKSFIYIGTCETSTRSPIYRQL